jgi:hypothetical protein
MTAPRLSRKRTPRPFARAPSTPPIDPLSIAQRSVAAFEEGELPVQVPHVYGSRPIGADEQGAQRAVFGAGFITASHDREHLADEVAGLAILRGLVRAVAGDVVDIEAQLRQRLLGLADLTATS